MRAAILLALALMAAPSCDYEPSVSETCERLCECVSFFPSEVPVCANRCATVLRNPQPGDCLACLDRLTCEDVEGDAEPCDADCYGNPLVDPWSS